MPVEEPLIHVERVAKRFCRDLRRSLWYGAKDLCSELFARRPVQAELRTGEFWAVEDISFTLQRGECLGLIGRNGAGKSTLLKMLNGLIKPDRGQITTRGHVGALIELGTGFNPILTGRENIYVNAAIHGIPKRVVDRKLDAIVDFAEMAEFIDTPYQNYSSGMKVRLGFAIAAQLEPDVLIIDEVLAVGDAGFRWKCYEVIDQLISKAAVIFVSHNMEAVTRICNRALVLNGGQPIYAGDPLDAANEYLKLFSPKSQIMTKNAQHHFHALRSDRASIEHGEDLRVTIEVESPVAYEDLLLKVNLTTTGGQLAAEYSSRNNGQRVDLRPGRNTITVELKQLQLLPQNYALNFSLIHNRADHIFWCRNLQPIEVRGRLQGHQPYQLRGGLVQAAVPLKLAS